MIYLDNLPLPPEHSGWWDVEALTTYVTVFGRQMRHQALEMRDQGGTKEDWEYLAEVTKSLALRVWDEIEKGG